MSDRDHFKTEVCIFPLPVESFFFRQLRRKVFPEKRSFIMSEFPALGTVVTEDRVTVEVVQVHCHSLLETIVTWLTGLS